MSLRRILAEEGLTAYPSRVAYGAIPKRVTDAADDFQMLLLNAGVRGGKARAFNSGYIGVVIEAGEAGKFLYLDQPGYVDSESQREGYVAFGRFPLSEPHLGLVYKEHRAQKFGDVDLTKAEWEDAWHDVRWELEKLLDNEGYDV